MMPGMLRALLCFTLLSTAARAGAPSPRSSVGVYAARPAPSLEKSFGDAGGSESSPPWPWLDPEPLKPDTGTQGEEELLGWLVSGDSAQRAEAQLRLLTQGESLLPRLEVLAVGAPDDEAKAAVLEFLEVLTARRVHPSLLGPYPRLSALAEKSVARGQELVAAWEMAQPARQLVAEFQPGLCATGPPPEPRLLIEGRELRELRDALGALGGLALPGIEKLMASGSTTSRLQGIVLAMELGLRPGAAALEGLRQDAREVELDVSALSLSFMPARHMARSKQGSKKVSVSKRASILERGLSMHWRERRDHEPFALRAEDDAHEWFSVARWAWAEGGAPAFNQGGRDLISSFRTTGAWEATDAQLYWNHARPLWRLWWTAMRTHPGPYERLRWSALASSAQGYQYRFDTHPSKESWLRIEAASPVKAELLAVPLFGKKPFVLWRGALPLKLRLKQPVSAVNIRVSLEGKWVDSGLSVSPQEGELQTLWLHPELLRRHLQEEARR
ncbi:hypothetical protein [Pyxidicoccus xibeiensis]|uniref:hypothetical protein n=1 Tax=Pyxidicoccus xibeiensis TaxID=2906759 RepID=UPI0020A74CE7|nr:hypothetical protein [Pyxidicoccus xibeiensis]MCP3136396.1 hypothetical protein [Pyxidicoccus xibeiensis]